MSDVVAAPTAPRAQTIRAPQVQTSVLTLGLERDCMRELAAALATLTSRKTAGAAGRYPFFAAQPEWPVAWQVRAHRAHQALTVGCTDDLDIALRIFSAFDTASDPEAWCSTWWIDHAALLGVAGEASDLMSLLDSVNGERDHPVDARRAEDVRSLLAESTSPVRFEPVSPGVYAVISGDGSRAEFHIAPTSLADPGVPIMAFGVLPQSPFGTIDRVVAFPGGVRPTSDPAVIETVIGELPVGTIVEIEAAEGGRISQLTVERAPFAPDGRSIELGRPTSSEGFAERGILTVEPRGDGSAGGYERLIITGYELRGDRVGLVVSPTSLETPADPARHGAGHGNRVTVRVDSLAAAAGETYRRLVVEPSGAVSYIQDAAGCSSTDVEFGTRLREGATLEAIALADDGGTEALAIRPVLYERLQSAATGEDGWYRAAIESLAGETVVVLDQQDESAGVQHVFAADEELLQSVDAIDAGTEVEAELTTWLRAMELPDGAHSVAESHPEVFARDEDGFVVIAPLDLEIVNELVAAQAGGDWVETVWRWFDESHQLHLTGLRTPQPVEEAPAPMPEEPPAPPAESVTVAARVPEAAVARIEDLIENGFEEAGIDATASFDGSVIEIDAASGPDARRAIEAVRRRALPAKGQIAIAAAEAEDDAAAVIEGIASDAGITITPDGDGTLTAEAETITSLRQLFAAVTEQISGAACTITAFVDIEMIENPGDEAATLEANPEVKDVIEPQTPTPEPVEPDPAADLARHADASSAVEAAGPGEDDDLEDRGAFVPSFAEASELQQPAPVVEAAVAGPGVVDEEPPASDHPEPVIELTTATGRTGGPPPRILQPEPVIELTTATGRTGGPPPPVIEPEPVIELTTATGRTGGPPPSAIQSETEPEPAIEVAAATAPPPSAVQPEPEPAVELTAATAPLPSALQPETAPEPPVEVAAVQPVTAPVPAVELTAAAEPPPPVVHPEPESEPVIELTAATGRTGGPARQDASQSEPPVMGTAPTEVAPAPATQEPDVDDPFVTGPTRHDQFVSSWTPTGETASTPYEGADDEPSAPPPAPEPSVAAEDLATAAQTAPDPVESFAPHATDSAAGVEPALEPEQPRRQAADRVPDPPTLRPGSLAARLRAAAAEGSTATPESAATPSDSATAHVGEPAAMPRDDVARRLHDWWSGEASAGQDVPPPPPHTGEPAAPPTAPPSAPQQRDAHAYAQPPTPPAPEVPTPQAPTPPESFAPPQQAAAPPETYAAAAEAPTSPDPYAPSPAPGTPPPDTGAPSPVASPFEVAPSPHSEPSQAPEPSEEPHPVPAPEPETSDFTRPDIDELTAYWFGTDPIEPPKPTPSRSRAYKREPVVDEEEELVELESEEEDPTTQERRRMTTRVVLGVSGFVLVGVIVLAIAMFFSSRPAADPAGPAADPLIVVPESSADAESPFAGLLPTAAAEPASCWQAVAGTFETESAAQEGADRLGDVGLPGVALASERVPGLEAGSFVASVTVSSESLADLAVERAGLAGFGDGNAVETPVADCDASGIVTTALGLGFLDVPTSRPDAGGIAFATAAGLLEPCVAPDSGLFCPEEPATVDDVASIARAIDAAAPGTGSAATELTSLAQAAGLPDAGVPPGGELTRGELADYLLETHESFGS